jgi:outer membrane protein OmpA-like peptidoglycan-associated protein
MTLNSARKVPLHARAATIMGLAGALVLAACTSTPATTAPVKAIEPANAAAHRIRTADAASPDLVRIQEVAGAHTGLAIAATDEQGAKVDSVRVAYTDSQLNADELKRRIVDLQAQVTDRGLVMTLGDVLFASAAAELGLINDERLGKLAGFLNKYPGCSAVIDGYTDSAGNDAYNRGLSQRRADAVRTVLMNQGIVAARLIATGRGEASPVGDNNTPAGRQQNRRVEVLIENTLVTSRQSCT